MLKLKLLIIQILRRKYFNPKGILEYFGSYNRYSKQIAKYAKENGITLIHNNTTAVLEGDLSQAEVETSFDLGTCMRLS